LAPEWLSRLSGKILIPLAIRRGMKFLEESNFIEKQEKMLKEKIKQTSKSNIGKKLGIRPDSPFNSIPLTTYDFYNDFYMKPVEGDFIYPLSEYLKVFTSGSMGKPKTFLVPKKGMVENMKTTGVSLFVLTTHDGEKPNWEVGDTMFRNAPGGSFISGFYSQFSDSNRSSLIKRAPKVDIPYHEKVDYFVENYRDIDFAYMNVSSLLDEICPRIGEKIHLKGLMTQDSSARVLKEEIKEAVGTYPKVVYGSTETFISGLPSIEYPGSFFMDWRTVYSEFIPEDKAINILEDTAQDPPDTIPLMDLEVGKRYQYVATPFHNDMIRYVTSDIFECAAMGDSILGIDQPIFNFYGRADRLISVHNFTRISEDEIISALRDAEVPSVEFTARVELHGNKEYMAMYIELSSPMEVEEVTSRLHEELLKVDKDWNDLTEFMKYTPLKVNLLPRGSFERYLGKKDGLPKIERIEMKEDRLRLLLETG